MKYKSIAILIFCTSVTPTAFAQSGNEEIAGAGTPNFIAKFLSTHKIGNSNIRQIDDNIGINTDYIVGRLSVFESRETGVNFPEPYALYGNISSGVNFAAGVRGDASSTTGQASGVIGVTYGPRGSGVLGLTQHPEGAGFGVSGGHGAAVGGGGAGVFGTTQSTTGFSSGVWGTAIGTTGTSVGVLGTTSSPDGVGGTFLNSAGGNILSGQVVRSGVQVNVFRVDGNGTVHANGGFRPFGADFAESVAVKGGPEHYAPGDLLVIDASGERRLSLSEAPYSTLVAGIYSTRPGVVASTHRLDETLPNNEVPLAVVGIVPCKVTAENGPIQIGDLLVTSSIVGHAMKGTDRNRMLGAVVGKALEPLPQGTGVIQVLVTLQ